MRGAQQPIVVRVDKPPSRITKGGNMAASRQIPIWLNVETDADILAYLDAQPNRTEAIRRAIRAQMKEEEA